MRPRRSRMRRHAPGLGISARGLAVIGGLLAISLVLAGRVILRHDALTRWRVSLAAGIAAPPWPRWNDTWPPLPSRSSTARGVPGDLKGPYAFAALNREVLRFIPCYCGCRREGHQSVLQCFVKDFTNQGVPVWTNHAFTCQICVNVVHEVMLMSARGTSVPAIRSAIDQHHGGAIFFGPTTTPLPK